MLKTITKLSIIAIIIGSVFIANGLILAWTTPSASPPESNVAAPLNVGSESQYKSGALGIGGVFRGYGGAIFGGKVGIGTANPVAKLHVAGTGKFQEINLGGVSRSSWPSGGVEPGDNFDWTFPETTSCSGCVLNADTWLFFPMVNTIWSEEGYSTMNYENNTPKWVIMYWDITEPYLDYYRYYYGPVQGFGDCLTF